MNRSRAAESVTRKQADEAAVLTESEQVMNRSRVVPGKQAVRDADAEDMFGDGRQVGSPGD